MTDPSTESISQSHEANLTSRQGKLKDLFLQDHLPPLDFLEQLMELDQSNAQHEDSIENAKVLEDSEVAKKIQELGDPTCIYKRLSYLAFFKFHHGQILGAVNNPEAKNTMQTAYNYKKKSIDYLKSLKNDPKYEGNDEAFAQIDQILEEQEAFVLYMQATAEYMDGQVESVETILKQLQELEPDEINTKIVADFVKGLRERNVPNYNEDYQPHRHQIEE